MRISDDAHRALPWVVHNIAQDFELLDVWRLPIVGDGSPGSDFSAFAELLSGEAASADGAAGLLFRLRKWLGERFGWDETERLPIPGCTENSVVQRLSPELAGRAPAFDPARDFQLVYQLPTERLAEISNRTVHALMHLSWVARPDGQFVGHLAVYCKTRGFFGRLYMAAITPFRLLLVYPAMLAHLGRQWRRRPAIATATATA